VEDVIAHKTSDGSQNSFSISGPARPGRYSLSLRSGSGALDYAVTARLDTSAAAQASAEAQVKAAEQLRDREMGLPAPGPSHANPLEAPSGSGETKASVAMNPQINFQNYRRYAFGQNPEKRLKDAAPGTDVGNPFIDEQIQRQIRYWMTDNDYDESPVDQRGVLTRPSAIPNRPR
jgi:hypothetical protein